MRGLLSKDWHRFLDQAIFYINETDNNYYETFDKLQGLDSVDSLLQRNFKEKFTELVRKSDSLKGMQISYSDQIGLKVWDTTLALIDGLVEFISLFSPENGLDIRFDKNFLRIRFATNPQFWSQDVKIQSYALTKKLMNSSVLLTHAVLDDEIELILDFRADLKKLYRFKAQEKNIKISFHKVFSDYQTSLDSILSCGKHSTLLLDSNGSFKTTPSLSQEFISKYYDEGFPYIVMHFSFLFRPISMIIPKGVIARNDSVLQGIVKNEEARNAQNFFLQENQLFLNFFNIFSQN